MQVSVTDMQEDSWLQKVSEMLPASLSFLLPVPPSPIYAQ
jgi:hypothetical protein